MPAAPRSANRPWRLDGTNGRGPCLRLAGSTTQTSQEGAIARFPRALFQGRLAAGKILAPQRPPRLRTRPRDEACTNPSSPLGVGRGLWKLSLGHHTLRPTPAGGLGPQCSRQHAPSRVCGECRGSSGRDLRFLCHAFALVALPLNPSTRCPGQIPMLMPRSLEQLMGLHLEPPEKVRKSTLTEESDGKDLCAVVLRKKQPERDHPPCWRSHFYAGAYLKNCIVVVTKRAFLM
mmetsp:Transcript_26401/g.62462  ORF Transcript_26401/g.62462 Transcript_26401/m.62462 type:complete len:233 (+) Transcript_26401:155-853(+)